MVDLLPGQASDNYVGERLENAHNALDGGFTRIRRADVRVFEEATLGATRLSITFRFMAGTDNLDSRAEADIERLAQLMKATDQGDSQLVLIGFSGTKGDYDTNRTLSLDRARAVRERLVSQMGVKNATAIGVGPTAPVACNTSGSAQASMNQRVEAWVRKGPGI